MISSKNFIKWIVFWAFIYFKQDPVIGGGKPELVVPHNCGDQVIIFPNRKGDGVDVYFQGSTALKINSFSKEEHQQFEAELKKFENITPATIECNNKNPSEELLFHVKRFLKVKNESKLLGFMKKHRKFVLLALLSLILAKVLSRTYNKIGW